MPEVDPKDFHTHLALDHYKFVPQGRSVGMTGGLTIYVHDSYRVKPRVPLSCCQEDWEMVFVDIFSENFKKPITLGNIYRPPRNGPDQIDGFIEHMQNTITQMGRPGKFQILAGDYNLNLLKVKESEKIEIFATC